MWVFTAFEMPGFWAQSNWDTTHRVGSCHGRYWLWINRRLKSSVLETRDISVSRNYIETYVPLRFENKLNLQTEAFLPAKRFELSFTSDFSVPPHPTLCGKHKFSFILGTTLIMIQQAISERIHVFFRWSGFLLQKAPTWGPHFATFVELHRFCNIKFGYRSFEHFANPLGQRTDLMTFLFLFSRNVMAKSLFPFFSFSDDNGPPGSWKAFLRI